MTNKSFSTMLLFLVIAGCSNDVDDNSLVYSYDTNSINFISEATKAISNDLSSMEGDANGFVVYGLEFDDSNWYNLIDGKNRYIYDFESQVWGWESEEAPSWPVPFTQMNFYAYYPESASGFSVTEFAPISIIGDIEVEQSILDQTDYLASSSGDIISKPVSGMQPLNFVHIMSKITFSVEQDGSILTVIRQLGFENIINKGSYDYINSEWYNLSNNSIGSFDDYVGSAGPFSKYGVEDQSDPVRIDGHYLMLIPQAGGVDDDQTPLWDGSVTIDDSGDLVPEGAYISIRYRTNSAEEDIVGYAIRESSSNETEWDEDSYFYSVYKRRGGTYTGPLYIKAGFKLTEQQLNWVAGSEYNYNLQLNKSGGIYLSEYYYDVDGQNTKIRVDCSPSVGDVVSSTSISVGVTVSGWSYYEYSLNDVL